MVLMGSTTTALRSDSFPAGLRVLVVDHDHAWLKILHKMLIKCNYKVSICNSAQEALDMLEKRKDGFDIVISDVNVADMDGFMFLEQVGVKMDLPVIMMSVDGETSRVMKGVQHGACDYLLKPIRMKELRNIWQHVFRKRIHQLKPIEPKQDPTPNKSDDNAAIVITNKRKDVDNEPADPTSLKKHRVVWTFDLHQKFLRAVELIGLDKIGPKKILDVMGVPWLTRENVASHLQKHRLHLSRQQKEKDLEAACNGMNLSDFPSERPNSVTLQQNIVINESYGAHIHNHCEAGILAMPMQAEADKLLFGGNVTDDPPTSRMDYNHPLKPEAKIQAHYTWNGGAPSPHLKPHFHQPEHHHFPLVSRREENQSIEANINHFYSKNRSYAIGADHSQPSITHSQALEEQNLQNNLESSFKNMVVETGSAAAIRLHGDVELNGHTSASDHIYNLHNPHPLVSLESFDCSDLVAADHAQPELLYLQHFEDEYDRNGVEGYETNQGQYFG